MAILVASPAHAENWSQFRGSNLDGVVIRAKLPLDWGPDKHILWKVALPGAGWSQPIVWGDKVFVTTAQSSKGAKPDRSFTGPGTNSYPKGASPAEVTYAWRVHCLDAATGKVIWEKLASEGPPPIPSHPNNTYASETPVTDGTHVVAYFGMRGLYCYDFAGKLLWKKALEPKKMLYSWGTGSSPMLHDGLVYLQFDNEESSSLVAFDVTTGDEKWRTPRDEKSNWSTPYIWRNKLRTELVAAGGKRMQSYDPKTGKELWSMRADGRTATTPIGDAELLYLDSYDRTTGLKGRLVAIRPGAAGDISLAPDETTNEYVAWSLAIPGGRMASPAICNGCLYIPEHFGGILRCVDAKTGKPHYRKRIPEAGGFMSSPIVSGGKVYCTDENCRTFVLAAGPELKILATSDLNEFCWSSPAVAGNALLIRTVDHLFAIGTSKLDGTVVD